jgi:transaldolase
MGSSPLNRLAEQGQSVWVDSLSRDMIHGGELARLIREDGVTGVTSNPSIFQKAIAQGAVYDEQLRELAAAPNAKEAFLALAVRDIQDACDVLRPVYDATAGADGYVSMEVDPTYAYDTEKTWAETVRLTKEIDRPNLLVKIPATEPGLPAIEDAIASGRSINVTLIFSLERYTRVAECYIRGLQRLAADGKDLSKVSSVASFFVSRVDTECDARLEAAGAGHLAGKLAVANAKLAYEVFERLFSGPAWDELAAKGARPQRPLWASTSTKNPAYRDVIYVEELIGPHTVNTMPEETIRAFKDHGEIARTIDAGLADAHKVLADIAAAGVSYDDVVAVLEAEGVQKFEDAFTSLLAGIEGKRAALAAG